MTMNKVLIIGISGTGKTGLAKKISDFLKIPVTHYDEFVWDENWNEVDEKIVEQKLEEVIKKDGWSIEDFNWNYLKVMWKRAERQEIEETIKGFENKMIRLKTRSETDNFLAKLLAK